MRKIDLYIGGKRADLSDEALLLMCYALTDLTEPTAVKNSYSRQVTLPGTPANDAIFGHIHRPDRTTGSGFDALARTPFVAYAPTGEVLLRGYCRLDKVATSQGRSYTLTLFGGLGSFLYGLMYRPDGEKMSLADLAWYWGSTAVDLSRTLLASNLATAWAKIDQNPANASEASLRVLNWMPAYNGLPEAFDSDKVLYYPNSGGGTIPASITDEDGHNYGPYNGAGLIKMPQARDEWAMRDLRAYLQRPCLSIKALLDTISKPANNGGWSVTWAVRPPQEGRLWMSLRRPQEIEMGTQGSTTAIQASTPATSGTQGTGGGYARQVGGQGTGTLTMELTPAVTASATGNTLYEAFRRRDTASDPWEVVSAATAIQVLALDSSQQVKAASSIYLLTNAVTGATAAEVAADAWAAMEAHGHNFYGDDAPVVVSGHYAKSGSEFFWDNPIQVTLTGERIASYQVLVLRWSDKQGIQMPGSILETCTGWSETTEVTSSLLRYGLVGTYSVAQQGSFVDVVSTPRSGVTLTQADLLGGTESPAAYLLALCKMFGWVILCDEPGRAITIMSRNDFFTGTAIDLTERVDKGKGVTLRPLYAEAQIYEFGQDAVGGKAQGYLERYGRRYGCQRVNTGYEFSGDIKQMADLPLRVAIPWVARGREYSYPRISSGYPINLEQDGYELTYGAPGASYTKAIQPIVPNSWTSYSLRLPFADCGDRAQFCDSDGKAVDGAGCLLYLAERATWGAGSDSNVRYALTDDNDIMYQLNGDKPCWLLARDTSVAGCAALVYNQDIPRLLPVHLDANGEQDTPWLTYGFPQEIYDPFIEDWDTANTLYGRYWARYMADLLDRDTKVLTARVNLHGLGRPQDLLRSFMFYRDSYWTISKINNHSLTTTDTTEVEMVQVRDMAAYTNGQTI